MAWQPIETAPEREEVRVKLPDGREALGEYWPPAPLEIDPRQISGGWAICLVGGGALDLGLDAQDIGLPTHWKPLPEPPTNTEGRG